MLSTSIEDYIKSIYKLEVEEQKATTKLIAERLGVKMASVTGMMKHLAAEGYVRHKPYHGVQLTAAGREVALDLVRRHRLIELFLSCTLGLTWDEVDADAEVLEHAVSDRLIERIYEYLGRPEFDPHGAPIPSKNGPDPPRRGKPLDQMELGEKARIVEVSDGDAEFLRYLTRLNVKIGSTVTVREIAPFRGPMTLSIGRKNVSIGRDACARIRVAVDPKNKPRAKS